MLSRRIICLLMVVAGSSFGPHDLFAKDAKAEWKAGVASVVITPEQSMWMAGYAARSKPSEGKVHDLYAKALAIEDAKGTRLVIVTTDLIGIPRALRDALEAEVAERYKLPPEGLLLNASHTHCGPELRATKASLYGLPEERVKQAEEYMESLQQKLVKLIGEALEGMQPAALHYTHARAGFAMNRRLPTEQGVQNRPHRLGPVDHEVPVLQVTDEENKLRAVLFGYACHNTTLGFYQFCGDYAGFAQQYLEEANPETTALFMTGCGGDQNPQPRSTLELAQHHGRALANAVEAALISELQPINGPLRASFDEVELEFADPPSRGELERLAKSGNEYDQRRAALLLEELDMTGAIKTTYPYPIQVVQFGDDLTIVALAGEVVVDYSLRLKYELAGPTVWIAGYSNDVFGYIPSLRVLEEGGYEGGGAMRYTTLPGPWAPSVEKLIITKVHELVGQARSARPSEAESDANVRD